MKVVALETFSVAPRWEFLAVRTDEGLSADDIADLDAAAARIGVHGDRARQLPGRRRLRPLSRSCTSPVVSDTAVVPSRGTGAGREPSAPARSVAPTAPR
ncbi:hypothetical protein [Streptomyces sp. NPDC059092]|uniref:hypothetical protein n=1 Tax=Streptomyces sp. NPDC059092 TaxID=3346725 RepID=UPI00368CA885